MILAQNQLQAVLLLVIGAFCWALWASMHKLTPKWRYELFYIDLAFGFGIATVVYGLTLGSLGFDGFSLMDDLMHAGRHEWVFAFAAGVVFNLANMILLGAVTVAGLSTAIPLGVGVASLLGVGIGALTSHGGNVFMDFAGSALVIIGIILSPVAYSFLISARQDRLVKEGKIKVAVNVPGHKKGMIVSTEAPSSTKGLLLTAVAGALMWITYPLLNKARGGELGLGPYALMLLFGLGVFGSSFIFDMFFINLPVEGDPIEPFAYFSGSLGTHLKGVIAGMILCTGILAEFVAVSGAPESVPAAPLVYGVKQTALLIAGLAGVWIWKEFDDGESRVRLLFYISMGFLAAGVACLIAAAKLGHA
jgi:glucose uptake protein